VDFDAFSQAHQHQWTPLAQLTKQRRLTGAEADELISLYNSTATHLSMLRSTTPDPARIQELSVLLAQARSKIVGARSSTFLSLKKFFVVDLPAAMYRSRWWTHGVTLVCVLIAIAFGVWVATTPEGLRSMGSEEQRLDYVNYQFAEYYAPGFDFATRVFTNNGWIALQLIAFGITGIWPVYVLLMNAVSVGQIAGMMTYYGEAEQFYTLILPHGFLELTAVFMAGGVGLKLFWVLVKPGRRPRAVALAEEGRSLVMVGIGMVLALLLSGVVEGWVTGSNLLWWVKILIGAFVLALFWAYVYILGGRAYREGYIGDQDEELRGYQQVYA
jgi:uncharacterized membrane protein SpoIIM required for sporulation